MENAKLTLKLKKTAIEHGKKYASYYHDSLSKMVEKFFLSLPSIKKNYATTKKTPLTPLVKELSGAFKTKEKINDKIAKTNYLNKKYL